MLFEQLGGCKTADFRIPFRVGKSLAAVPDRNGSGVRGASAIGPGRLISVEKDRGTDPCRGEIDATLKSETRVMTCIMEASSASGC